MGKLIKPREDGIITLENVEMFWPSGESKQAVDGQYPYNRSITIHDDESFKKFRMQLLHPFADYIGKVVETRSENGLIQGELIRVNNGYFWLSPYIYREEGRPEIVQGTVQIPNNKGASIDPLGNSLKEIVETQIQLMSESNNNAHLSILQYGK